MLTLYNLLLVLAAPFWVTWMWLRTRARAEKPDWRERMGLYRGLPKPTPAQPRVWVHAVSVGGGVAAMPILRELRRLAPHVQILLSVTTSSGHQTAREKATDLYDSLVYFPLDVPRYVLHAMVRARPSVVAIMETELWMNFLHFAQTFGARTVLLNGRISDRSYPRSMKIRFFYRALLKKMDRCLMQTPQDAERIQDLGAQEASVLGNCKFDEAIAGTDADPNEWRQTLGIAPGARVVVVGSTRGEDEEAFVLDALARLTELVVVYAPRHLERLEPLRTQAQKSLGEASLRSEGGGGRCILLDTYGELSKIYCVADVVIIGGGFGPYGGQNLIQPLAHGKPVLHGPHMQNFRDASEAAARVGATQVCATPDQLADALQSLLNDAERREAMGRAARQMIEESRGASQRYAEAILAELPQAQVFRSTP